MEGIDPVIPGQELIFTYVDCRTAPVSGFFLGLEVVSREQRGLFSATVFRRNLCRRWKTGFKPVKPKAEVCEVEDLAGDVEVGSSLVLVGFELPAPVEPWLEAGAL